MLKNVSMPLKNHDISSAIAVTASEISSATFVKKIAVEREDLKLHWKFLEVINESVIYKLLWCFTDSRRRT